MMRQAKTAVVTALLVAGLVAVGCQRQGTGPSVADFQKQREAIIKKQKRIQAEGKVRTAAKATTPEGEAMDDTFAASGKGYVYDPIGKRDPFRSFILDRVKEVDSDAKGPLEQFDLSQLSVTGVVWEAENRRALILDPSGQAYIVQEGDPIGKNDGRVIGIQDNAMLVREAYVDFHGEKTTKEIEMRVRQSEGG